MAAIASAGRYAYSLADGRTATRWRARWTTADGKRGERRGFTRRADALAYAQDREAEARHGVILEPEAQQTSRTTLAAWSATWLSGLSVRDNTRAAYELHLRVHVLPKLGARPLGALRPSELKQWRSGLVRADTGAPLAATTSEAVCRTLAIVLRAAVEDGLLERSPMRGVIPRQEVEPLDPAQLLTQEQVLAWDAALPAHCRGMAVVAATTGLRLSELLGLRAERVDFLRRRLEVVEQMRVDQTFGPPKNAVGRRAVPLSAPAAEALAAHMAAYPSPPGEPIYLSAWGRRWTRRSFGKVATAARQAAGLPAWAHWHALRDRAATDLIAAGVDLRVVTSVIGHSDPKLTMQVYARVLPASEDRARAALDAAWGQREREAR